MNTINRALLWSALQLIIKKNHERFLSANNLPNIAGLMTNSLAEESGIAIDYLLQSN